MTLCTVIASRHLEQFVLFAERYFVGCSNTSFLAGFERCISGGLQARRGRLQGREVQEPSQGAEGQQ